MNKLHSILKEGLLPTSFFLLFAFSCLYSLLFLLMHLVPLQTQNPKNNSQLSVNLEPVIHLMCL